MFVFCFVTFHSRDFVDGSLSSLNSLNRCDSICKSIVQNIVHFDTVRENTKITGPVCACMSEGVLLLGTVEISINACPNHDDGLSDY